MAGSYPDAPSRRIAYDDDGTVILWDVAGYLGFDHLDNAPGPMALGAQGDIDNINDEDHSTRWLEQGTNLAAWIVFLMPQLMDIDGVYWDRTVDSPEGASPGVAFATDGNNGVNHTWQDLGATLHEGDGPDGYRANIDSVAENSVVALQAWSPADDTISFWVIHFYGVIAAGETPDRLLFLDPDNSDAEFTRPLDFGDVPRGQTQTDTFKVINNSGSLTANTVSIDAEDLDALSDGWYEFSDDNITYTTVLAVGNLGPGADSGTLYLRQVVPDLQTPGVYAARIRANVASWT